MKEKRSLWEKTEKFLAGKGFYIVLCACAAVIGVSAWIMLASGGNTADEEEAYTVSQVIRPGTQDETDVQTQEITPVQPDIAVSAPVEEPAPEPELEELHRQEDESENQPIPEPGDDSEPEEETLAFVMPVSGETVNAFSSEELVYNKTMADWRTHPAVDIAAQIGTRVLAAAKGTVEKVYEDDLYGTTVVIDHGGELKSVYSNLASQPTVSAGDSVAMGAVIGAVGDTAIGESVEVAHLHFAMEYQGVPVDPNEYMK
ncbi:MAG: M23 family metallopeptidase [Oscillospiraceae bacterium]|nr:M23 family metallopeptidase [Oscillospiraceae bacterium]